MAKFKSIGEILEDEKVVSIEWDGVYWDELTHTERIMLRMLCFLHNDIEKIE